MQDEPLVSILIPTFRRSKDLRRMLESAAAQTYANVEIVIANNDCEDKETNELCREFAAKDKRIVYHAQPVNIGGWNNNTFLINEAKGEYCLMTNDDDWISAVNAAPSNMRTSGKSTVSNSRIKKFFSSAFPESASPMSSRPTNKTPKLIKRSAILFSASFFVASFIKAPTKANAIKTYFI